jgi:hypothetical protein
MPADDELKKLREEVARYPTDLQRRMQLGTALAARHSYVEAIPELQKAMGSPHTHLQAMRLLVEAFDATHMHDLAAQMRERLSRESGDQDDSGSAPVPAPTRPIRPQGTSQAEKPPHEDRNG